MKYALLVFSIINGVILTLLVRLFIFHIYLKIKGLSTYEYLKNIRYIPVSKKKSKKVFAVRNKDKIKKKINLENSKNSSFECNKKKVLCPISDKGGDTPAFNRDRREKDGSSPKDALENFVKKKKDIVIENNDTYKTFQSLKKRVMVSKNEKTHKMFSRKNSKIFPIEEKIQKKRVKSLSDPHNELPLVVRRMEKRISCSLCTLNNEDEANKTTQKGSVLVEKSDKKSRVEVRMTKSYMTSNKRLDFQMKIKEKMSLKLELPTIPDVTYTHQTVSEDINNMF